MKFKNKSSPVARADHRGVTSQVNKGNCGTSVNTRGLNGVLLNSKEQEEICRLDTRESGNVT